MGEMEVPADALYGASTQRAVLNFPISDRGLPPRFLHALALIKLAASETNGELGLLDAEIASAIADAAREVADGDLLGRPDVEGSADVLGSSSSRSSASRG